ncbi:MAG: hypothetical protein ABS951_06720 [Solibacillus sp.]
MKKLEWVRNNILMNRVLAYMDTSVQQEELLICEIEKIMKSLRLKNKKGIKECDQREIEFLICLLKARQEESKIFQFLITVITISGAFILNLVKTNTMTFFAGLFSLLFVILLSNMLVVALVTRYSLLIELLGFYKDNYLKK